MNVSDIDGASHGERNALHITRYALNVLRIKRHLLLPEKAPDDTMTM